LVCKFIFNEFVWLVRIKPISSSGTAFVYLHKQALLIECIIDGMYLKSFKRQALLRYDPTPINSLPGIVVTLPQYEPLNTWPSKKLT